MAAAVFAKLNTSQVSNLYNLKTREEMFSSDTYILITGKFKVTNLET